MLELKNIQKSYKIGDNSQQVLKGINLKFRKSEFASILGTSGSGKTTLLNIIGGLDKYDKGDLVIEGISTQKYNDRDWDTYRNYRVGFIFQSYNLIMHQSVLSNVEIALTLSGVSKSERKKKAIEALTRVGLKDHINKKPNQLSGGQMQRVAIARALVNNPEIILADEPTGALDSKTSIQIMDLLKEIAKDKLVIMVTHNPELAKEYSTRIIELKDGSVINDSNPYDEEFTKKDTSKTRKTAMSLLTSLSLSFNNLLTKKGRTFLTAFAGSVGIIGIALIMSLTNGINIMASNMEQESIGDYPISIERTSSDIFGILSSSLANIGQTADYNDDKLHSKDDLVAQNSISDFGSVQKNNLKEFKKFIDNNEEIKKHASEIIYGYKLDLQVYTNKYEKVNPSELSSEDSQNIFTELENREEVLNEKYKVLAGKLPENYNEVVLVVDKSNEIPDSILYSLDIKNKEDLANDLQKMSQDDKYKVESTAYSYDDFIGKTYKLILNTDYYAEQNGIFIDYSNNSDYMHKKIDNGIDIKIVGVVKYDDSQKTYIGYKHDLTLKVIEEISKTNIYKKQMENKNVNVLTGKTFDNFINTYDDLISKLGIYDIDDPSNINIYPKDYNSKEAIVKAIDDYNQDKKDKNQNDLVISYSDMMKSFVGGIKKVVNMVSAVLIGLVAISLIVSSIMIAIITYISVLERTKEIGILRAIGASKKDIKRVFTAETIIEGLIAGLFGVGIALLISLPINAIVKSMADIDTIAKLPLSSAIILILLSVVLNVIAGTLPSKMAAKKDPVESLRNE